MTTTVAELAVIAESGTTTEVGQAESPSSFRENAVQSLGVWRKGLAPGKDYSARFNHLKKEIQWRSPTPEGEPEYISENWDRNPVTELHKYGRFGAKGPSLIEWKKEMLPCSILCNKILKCCLVFEKL